KFALPTFPRRGSLGSMPVNRPSLRRRQPKAGLEQFSTRFSLQLILSDLLLAILRSESIAEWCRPSSARLPIEAPARRAVSEIPPAGSASPSLSPCGHRDGRRRAFPGWCRRSAHDAYAGRFRQGFLTTPSRIVRLAFAR